MVWAEQKGRTEKRFWAGAKTFWAGKNVFGLKKKGQHAREKKRRRWRKGKKAEKEKRWRTDEKGRKRRKGR